MGQPTRYNATFSLRAETSELTRGFNRARQQIRTFSGSVQGELRSVTSAAQRFALGITAIVAPVGLLAARGISAANEINRLTMQTDLSARAAAGWVNAFRAFGAQADDVEDVIRTLTTRIFELRAGEDTALTAFTALGASASDFGGDSSQNLQTFLRLLAGVDEQTRSFVLDELLGDSARFLSQMSDSVTEVNRLRTAAERVHQPTERLSNQWRSIRADIGLAADTLGTSFLQGLVGTNDLSELTANLAENLPTIAESVERLGAAVRGFASFIGTIAPFLGIFGGFGLGARLGTSLVRPIGLLASALNDRFAEVNQLGRLGRAAETVVNQFRTSERGGLLTPLSTAVAGGVTAGVLSFQARGQLRDAISGPVEEGVREGVREGLERGIRQPIDDIRAAAEDYSFALTDAVFEHRAINAELSDTKRLWDENLTVIQNIERSTISAFQNAPQAAISFHRNLLLSTGEEIRRLYQGVRSLLPEAVGNELDALLSTFQGYPETLIPLRESAADVTTTMVGLEDALTTNELVVQGFSNATEDATDAVEEFANRLEGFVTRRILEPADRGRPRTSFAGEIGFDAAAARLADATASYLERRGGAFSEGFESARASGAEDASLRALDAIGGTEGVLASIRTDEVEQLGAQITQRLTDSLQFGIRSSISGFLAGRDAGDIGVLGESLLDAITGSIARNFADAVTRSLFDPIIEGFTTSIFGSFNESLANLGGQVANLITGLFSGFNLGSIFSGIGSILGFQGGGVIPGPIGQPRLVVAHSGEHIFTPDQRREFRRGGDGGNIIVQLNGIGDITNLTNAVITNRIPEIVEAVQVAQVRRGNYYG